MTLQPPTEAELHDIAARNHFTLKSDEIAAFQALLPPMFEMLEHLDRMVVSPSPLAHRRDSGRRPTGEEDPLNAIVRRCSVKGSGAGKLAGMRIGLKDNIGVAGIPMSCGSRILQGYVPDEDATIVTRLLSEGAEIGAMLNMDDLASSAAGDTSAYGPILNPHNPDYLAGGSSGGSAAALYYDDISGTVGCDQGGSIRIPAACCGVVGLKPTYGLVPFTGIVGNDATIDHVGPMARTVRTVALMLEVMAGKDPADFRQQEVPVQPYSEMLEENVKGLRVAVVHEGFGTSLSEPDVDQKVRDAIRVLQNLGAEVREMSIRAHEEARGVGQAIVAEGMTALMNRNGLIYHTTGPHNVGLAVTLGKNRRERGNDLPTTAKLWLVLGSYLGDRHQGRFYGKAQSLRRSLRSSYDQALSEVDVLAMPTLPMKARKHEKGLDLLSLIRRGWTMSGNTAQFDITGHPSISIPCGKSDGLPVGLMLTGRYFDEATLLRVAYAFERSTRWEEM